MGKTTINIDCEFAAMGLPRPARLVLSIQDAEDPTVLSIEFMVDLPAAGMRGTLRAERDQVIRFTDDLRRLHGTAEGEAVLQDEDAPSYLRVRSENGRQDALKVSGIVYSLVTDIQPNPEEADFFLNVWALASGFQGLRVSRSALPRILEELVATLRSP